jgi:hypothetical protein
MRFVDEYLKKLVLLRHILLQDIVKTAQGSPRTRF